MSHISDRDREAAIESAVKTIQSGGRLSEQQLRRIADAYGVPTTPTQKEVVDLLKRDGKLPRKS